MKMPLKIAVSVIMDALLTNCLSAGFSVSESHLDNINVSSLTALPSPAEFKSQLPASAAAARTVEEGRASLRAILERRDHRLMAVVGPCSVHDVDAAIEYAERLRGLAEEIADAIVVVMRVYFEKPRTTVGWKGLINDPQMNDSFKVGDGLRIARQLLLDINEMGLPTGTEALDPIVPQYLHDLISWSAIGARTTESQTHREMASGLSSPVGFKNGTDGSLEVVLNALQSVSRPHRFLGIDDRGQVSVIHTKGNRHAHTVLRGGGDGPNYQAEFITRCEEALRLIDAAPNIVVDCSHANCNKEPRKQLLVVEDLNRQIQAGNQSIVGLMLESHLEEGRQDIPDDPADLRYGVSITDPCMDWSSTEDCLLNLRRGIVEVLPKRAELVAA